MSNLGHNSSRVLIGTVILLAVPLLAFPNQFGTGLGKAGLLNIVIELGYYATVLFFLNRSTDPARLAILAGACLGYRLALGLVFGLMVSIIYSVEFVTGLRLGLYAYLPVALIQVAGAPFALRPVLERYFGTEKLTHPVRRESTAREQQSTGSIVYSRERAVESRAVTPTHEPEAKFAGPAIESVTVSTLSELNGFERATRYIGEHGSVYLAAVVDSEGLLLANFKRGNLIPEDWAPMALVLYSENARLLEKTRLGSPDKIDVLFHEKRLVVTHDQRFSLMVLAERQSDDTLAIRINQCMEMIRKYMNERYSQPKQEVNAERIHVSHS